MNTILVTGATGGYGGAVINHLVRLRPSASVAALVRSKSKAAGLFPAHVDMRVGDYADPESLVRAMTGVHTLVLVSAPAFSDAVQLHQNAIRAAKEAGVRHIYYTAIQRSEQKNYSIPQVTAWDDAAIEDLKLSGIPYTILRNTMYLDALPFMLGDISGTTVFAPAGNALAALATRDDLAEAAAILASGTGHEGKTYTLGGSSLLSMADVVRILGEAQGKSIEYVDCSVSKFIATRVQSGIPDFVLNFVAAWFGAIKASEFAEVTGDLERILGRVPTPAAVFLPALFTAQDAKA